MKGTPFKELTDIQVGQHIDFYNNETGHNISYIVMQGSLGYYCNHPVENNDLIFKHLKIDKEDFHRQLLGYSSSGQFPYCHSLKDLGIMLRKLWALYYENMWKSLDYTSLCMWPKTLRLMCQMQMKQGNPVNPTVFLKNFSANKKEGGFDWSDTPYENLFSMLLTDGVASKERDRVLKGYLNHESEPIEKQQTITIKTKHYAIRLQDKKASVRRGNLPEGSSKRGGKSKTAVGCGHLRNKICHR